MTHRLIACMLLLMGSTGLTRLSTAAPTLPAFLLERFDTTVNDPIDAGGRETVAIYGDVLDLGGKSIFVVRPPRKRVSDVIIVARTIKLGPKTSVELGGQVAVEDINALRGGDLYLVADNIELNGYTMDGILGSPANIQREGGFHSMDAKRERSRSGRVFVFANKVTLADEFIRARVAALNVSGSESESVPAALLKIISRSFSPANSIHRAVAEKQSISWAGLGEAYRSWLDEEPPSAVAVRELHLSLTSTHAMGNADVVGALGDAVRYIPEELLAPWYLTYLKRNAGIAQAAIVANDYPRAAQAVRNAKPFAATAPNAALTSSAFITALASLQQAEKTLASQTVVDQLSFPVEGGPPVRITAIRDLAGTRVSVIPHQVLLNGVLDNGILRLGFMSLAGQDVRVQMRGRLVVDPGLLELVQARFPGAEISTAEQDISYGSVNLGLGNTLVSGGPSIGSDGIIDFDLFLQGTQLTRALQQMAQGYGIDATLSWRVQQGSSFSGTSRLNVALSRTDMAIVASGGLMTNTFRHPLTVDYVLDGNRTLSAGMPIRLAPGATFKPGCATALCHAPGAAIRRELDITDVNSWFVSIPATSAVQNFVIENQLEDDPARGGSFRSLVLYVSYTASPSAAPQQAGPFTLGPRGSFTAKRTLQFLAPLAANGKVEISGRAYWGNGQSYTDLANQVLTSNLILIDALSLK